MEKAIAELSSKVKILNFRLAKTDKLIEKSEALNRHKLSMDNIVSTVNSLKETVEEEKNLYIKARVKNKYKNGAQGVRTKKFTTLTLIR